MKILVIDDEEWLRENLVTILELEGYEVISASQGVSGVRLARETHPDLIICDIMMPELDGYGVLAELQSQLSTANIPFIFLTAKSERIDRRQGMELGADDFLTKPVADDELLAAIQSRLAKRQHLALEQYQTFAAQLVGLKEQQQARFADLLQARFYQELTDLGLMLKLSRQLQPSALLPMLDRFTQSVDALAGQALRLSQEFRPYLLDEVGLVGALEWYLDGVALQTTLQGQNMADSVPPQVERCIYRLVQEAVGLAATFCQVMLWRDQDVLHLQIELDRPNGVAPSDQKTTVMLMQEQTRLGGGAIDIQFDAQISIHVAFGQMPPTPQGSWRGERAAPAPPTSSQLHFVIATTDVVLGELLHQYLDAAFLTQTLSSFPFDTLTSELISSQQPHILILDNLEGMQAIITQVPTIFLSAYNHSTYVQNILGQGVRGVVLKSTLLSDIEPAIMALLADQLYTSSAIDAEALLYPSSPPTKFDIQSVLTNREYDVLTRILQDKTHADIAEELVISHRTVEKHRANFMQKLGLKTHTELILFAVRHGLIAG